jgi:hypothetical protein
MDGNVARPLDDICTNHLEDGIRIRNARREKTKPKATVTVAPAIEQDWKKSALDPDEKSSYYQQCGSGGASISDAARSGIGEVGR